MKLFRFCQHRTLPKKLQNSFTRSVKKWQYFRQLYGQSVELLQREHTDVSSTISLLDTEFSCVECLHHSKPRSSSKRFLLEGVLRI